MIRAKAMAPVSLENHAWLRYHYSENKDNLILDTAFKHCLSCYGGRGYAHINENVIPLMRAKGMTDDQIHTITVENPKRLLTFVEPVE